MSKSKKKMQPPEDDGTPRFKIKIDLRTTITVKGKEAVDRWLQMYPKAEVIPA